ncbi:MAG: actin, cytoplasmic 2 [Myxococcales bacterium]|nr:actin, cytoplasmic 2 [Myxococcales bacterium]
MVQVGSGRLRAGFAGDDTTRVDFPLIVGRARNTGIHVGMGHKLVYIGDEAVSKRGVLTLAYPIDRGRVVDWDGIEKVLNHTLVNELRAASAEHAILLAISPIAPAADREQYARILFEVLAVPALYIASTAVLSLNASARTTGLVLDLDEGTGAAVPIYEGHTLPHAVSTLDVAPREVTDTFIKLLGPRGEPFVSTGGRMVARDIMEKLAYVALDYGDAMAKSGTAPKRPYTMPDGSVLEFGSELFGCTEILFQPQLAGHAGPGIHQLIHAAIQKCDAEIRADLYGGVVLSGSPTLFPGMAERLQKELAALAPPGTAVKVHAPPGRHRSAWVGGSMLAALKTFEPMWITAAAYRKDGAAVIRRQLF